MLFDDPNNCEALLGLAEIHRARKDWDAVMIDTAVILDQFQLIFGQASAGCGSRKLKRYDEMVELAKAMADKAPDDIEVVTLLCKACHNAGNYSSTIYAAEHALTLDPNAEIPLILRACGYYKLGFQEIALQKIDEALQKYPENIYALQNKAVIMERLLRLDEAIAIYDRILEKRPDDERFRSDRSMSLLLKGDFKQGFSDYEYRWAKELKALKVYRGEEPVWNGEDISGKRLLIIRNRDTAIPSWHAALSNFSRGMAQKSPLPFRSL